MHNWHRQFLGRTQMPPEVSALAISEFFTLSGAELQAVLSRYGVDMRLGAALQIGLSEDVWPATRQAAARAGGWSRASVRPGRRIATGPGYIARRSTPMRHAFRIDTNRARSMCWVSFDSTRRLTRPEFSKRSATRYAQASMPTSSWRRRVSFFTNVTTC